MSANVKIEDIYLGKERGIWFVATRVTIVVVLTLVGSLSNGLVLIIYRRDKKQSGAIYITALAVIDLFTCIVILPQLPFKELIENFDWHVQIYLDKVYFAVACSGYYAYLFLQVAMALDQVIAVFRPFKHTRMRKKLNGWLTVVCSLIIVMQTAAIVQPSYKVYQLSLAFFVVLMIVCFATLIVSYIATALKLYVQGRAIRPKTERTVSTTTAQERRTEAEQQPPPPALGKRRAMHIQALKIYTSILFAFFVANLAAAAVALFDMKWMMYVCYVNYTANPLIYYCFVEKFRNSVKEYWRRLIAR